MSNWSDERLISALEALDDRRPIAAALEKPGPQARQLAAQNASNRRRRVVIATFGLVVIGLSTGLWQYVNNPGTDVANPGADPIVADTTISQTAPVATELTAVERARFRLVELIRAREAMELSWWNYNNRMADIANENSQIERDRADQVERTNRIATTFFQSVVGNEDEANLNETKTKQLRNLIRSFPDTVAAQRAATLLGSAN